MGARGMNLKRMGVSFCDNGNVLKLAVVMVALNILRPIELYTLNE